jgi:hypothetical protein
MPIKQDVQKFATLVETTVEHDLKTLAGDVLDDGAHKRIYECVFGSVSDVVQRLGINASNELVNCIAQSLYSSVRINEDTQPDMNIFTRLINPRDLPENERPFVYAFFDDDRESN